MPFFYFLLLLIVSFSTPAWADDNTPPDLKTFEKLLEKLRQHPEIASYSAKAESVQHYAKGELGLPDPVLFAQEQDYPIGSSMSRNQEEKMIGFKQEIPAFGTLSSKSKKMGADARKQQLAADYAFASMKAKLITTLANWKSIKKQEKLLDEQIALFNSEKTSIKGRIIANQSGVSQLSMSKAESTEAEIMRTELMEQRHELEAMLTNMLGSSPDVELPEIKPTEWNGDVEKTYLVRLGIQDIEMAHKDVDLREAEFNPKFEVQASYGRMYGGDNSGTIMVGVSIPLWASESQTPRLEGAKAALSATQSDQDNIKRQVKEKLDHLRAQITSSEQKIKLFKVKNTHLTNAASAITREYEAGKADFAMYLKAKRDAISASISLAQEQAKHIGLIADFNHYFIEGSSHE